MPQVTYQVLNISGTGEEIDDGRVIIRTYPSPGRLGGIFYQYHLFRFINIDIPQGSEVNSAYLQLPGYSHAGTPPDMTIYCEAENNPTAMVTTVDYTNNSEISLRKRSTSSVLWSNPTHAYNYVTVTTPDLKTIIQEQFNRSNWQRGNAINIITVTTDPVADDNYNYFRGIYAGAVYGAKLVIDYTPSSSGTIEAGKNKQKDFIYKVYDENGSYLATWADEVVNVPNFTWQINGGMGELVIGLKRQLKDFGEAEDVKFGNIVKCYIQDGDQEKGKKIWEGKINRYEPLTSNDNTEIIDVVCTSRILEMEKRLVKDGSNTQVTYSSKDPSHILKALISQPAAGGILLAGLINDTGTTASYTFNANTIREGFDIVRKLSPQYWYFWLNADNEINFKVANFDEIDHKLTVGKEVSGIKLTKSTEELCNRVYFMGGGSPNLYKMYERTSSQSEFGLREVFIKDERVTVAATAQLIATTHLDAYDHPISEIELEVVDSNIDPIDGYDIERFKPGDIVQITHPEMEKRDTLWDVAEWDVDYWDFDIRYAIGQPHQILEITYEFNKCILRLSAKTIDFQKRIEEINRNLEETAKQNLPAAPS